MRRDYSDIIDRERPVSKKHSPMDRMMRAAQFAPFAALVVAGIAILMFFYYRFMSYRTFGGITAPLRHAR